LDTLVVPDASNYGQLSLTGVKTYLIAKT